MIDTLFGEVTGGRPVLFGVDIVDIGRVTRAIAYSGPAYLRHVTTPQEHGLHPDAELAAAASVAVKECFIKAVGGRPPGFSWHDFRARGDVPHAAREWAGPLLAGAAPEVEKTTGIALGNTSAYSVHGASHAAALTRLAPGRSAAAVVAEARWGWPGDRVVAHWILTATTDEEQRWP
ncbi:holo-ACP synthase [Saccharothrix hoggarensis]|uniref:Phosphopantetheinyl transferase n=1 Tax=Saccharothrix hoggarensis TaxID=913853 RepID=A0ABW3QWD8_9PSEU